MRVPAARSVSKFSIWLPISMLLIAPCALAESGGELEHVLKQMDEAAARFRTTQASFTWTQYNKVVDEVTDTQKGKIYFRRSGTDIQMAADITQPNAKQVIFSSGRIQVYQPRIDQVDVYDAGAHREEFESFLVLGFGSSGHEMLKAFGVKYVGDEKIDGVNTTKLDLTPKSEKVKQNFAHILLWIDPQTGLSVQQQLFEPNGDNRLAKYFDIQVNQKISDNVFKLKTSAKTKIVTH
jgi:outer membrane lipoprotein-sorting protein